MAVRSVGMAVRSVEGRHGNLVRDDQAQSVAEMSAAITRTDSRTEPCSRAAVLRLGRVGPGENCRQQLTCLRHTDLRSRIVELWCYWLCGA